MGGGYYDRDVYSSSSSWGYSSTASSAMSTSKLDDSMKPASKPILESNSKYPVILILDVTGSNINFARVIYDKLPMFYGEIMAQGYLDDCELSVCAVGDVLGSGNRKSGGDRYPLQIGSFNKGTDIDSEIKKLVLEAGGNGQGYESYELIADYFLHNYHFDGDAKPILFFLGDELPRDTITADDEIGYGVGPGEDRTKEYVFTELNKKFENRVYMMLNEYSGDFENKEVWDKLMPSEHVIKVEDTKSIVDLILGIIAINYQKRNINTYKIDMLKRGQDQLRVDNVAGALDDLSKTFAITPVINQTLDLLKGGKQSTVSVKSNRI